MKDNSNLKGGNMGKLKLVFPNNDYKFQYLDFIEECKEDLELNGFECCFPISTKETIDNDIITLRNRRKGINLLEGWVPDSVLWMFDEFNNEIVGSVSIRHRLTENLKFRGGHIAYYIKPSERNKGYASKMLFLALKYCKETLGINKVLITCSKDNVYSAKTILNNGGMLYCEDMDNNEKIQRYYIYL